MSRADDPQQTYREFTEAVNMQPGELSSWLQTAESKQVGSHKGGRSGGGESGRPLVRSADRRPAPPQAGELSAADYQHMRTVIGYVHRHLAQRPAGDVRDTKWRWSLMNWGHDPLR